MTNSIIRILLVEDQKLMRVGLKSLFEEHKDLEIVEPTDIASLLQKLPACNKIVSTGQKSAEVLSELFACKMPKMGEFCTVNYQQRTLQFYRMPSSSRAYPLKLEEKAEMYRKLFEPYA